MLTSFIDWASQTELQDLNFMVPNNPTVQGLLQNIMQNNKLEEIKGYQYPQKLLFLNENFQLLSMKDKEIIRKFCQGPE